MDQIDLSRNSRRPVNIPDGESAPQIHVHWSFTEVKIWSKPKDILTEVKDWSKKIEDSLSGGAQWSLIQIWLKTHQCKVLTKLYTDYDETFYLYYALPGQLILSDKGTTVDKGGCVYKGWQVTSKWLYSLLYRQSI
jgi:hypothetical protein